MVNYIAAAPQDYLAHPRFWAPFIIAGDGAVRPLDGAKASADDRHEFVRLESEGVTSNIQEVEFLGLAKNTKSIFALGMLTPPEGEKRAGSYLARISPKASIEVLNRTPELAPSSVVPIGEELGVFGTLKSDQGDSAVFRLLDTLPCSQATDSAWIWESSS